MSRNWISWIRLAFALVLCLGIGFAGSTFTASEIPTWYAGLTKPAWTPPPFVFPIVWTILYVLMGISLWRLWNLSASAARNKALAWFFAQLALNAIWTPVFFGLHAPLSGLAIIVLMLIAISGTIWAAMKIDRVAAYLLVPYLAWVAYATTLNAGIVAMN